MAFLCGHVVVCLSATCSGSWPSLSVVLSRRAVLDGHVNLVMATFFCVYVYCQG